MALIVAETVELDSNHSTGGKHNGNKLAPFARARVTPFASVIKLYYYYPREFALSARC